MHKFILVSTNKNYFGRHLTKNSFFTDEIYVHNKHESAMFELER